MGRRSGTKVRGISLGWMDKHIEKFIYENKNQGLMFSSFTDLTRYAFYQLLRKFPGYEEVAEVYENDMKMVPGEVYKRRIVEVNKRRNGNERRDEE